MSAADRMEYTLLVGMMAFASLDRESLIAFFRSAYRNLPHEEYLAFQEDVREILRGGRTA